MKLHFVYGLCYLAIMAPISIAGVSPEDLQSLVDDIRHGHYHTIKRIVPTLIKPTVAIRGAQTPLQVAKDELAQDHYAHVSKNIRHIVNYLEGVELKWNLYNASHTSQLPPPKTIWDKLVEAIKYGHLGVIYSTIPMHIKPTDKDSQGRTPLEIAQYELIQPHRNLTKKNIQTIITYLKKLEQPLRTIPLVVVSKNTNPRKKTIKKTKKKAINTPAVITFYDSSKPYFELANAYPISHDIMIDDHSWPTVEHYFQAQKFKDKRIRDRIAQTPAITTVFNIVEQNIQKIDPEWYQVPATAVDQSVSSLPLNEQVMLKALRIKFAQKPFKNVLLNTDDAYLKADVPDDPVWGYSAREQAGINLLGKMLMHVRNELRAGGLLQFDTMLRTAQENIE